LIHIQVTKGVEIMYNICCFPVDPFLNSPELPVSILTGREHVLIIFVS